MTRSAVYAFALWLAACSQDRDPLPPRMRPQTPVNVYTCSELASAGLNVQGRAVMVGGSRAGCLADDLVCPLARLGVELALCDAGAEAEARCLESEWRIECLSTRDSGEEVEADTEPSADAPSTRPADAATDGADPNTQTED